MANSIKISGVVDRKQGKYRAGFEILTAVVMKNPLFWDIMPCSPLKINRGLRDIFSFHLEGRRI
jgi:hypothetical protein